MPSLPSPAASLPASDGSPRTWRLRGAACALFLLVSLAWVAVGRDERSGWNLMTSPTGADHDGNSLLGYCFLHGDKPFMKENIPHVAQVGAFCGSIDAFHGAGYRQDFRLLRGLYSFLASLPAPFIGVIPALLLVNWLSWAICGWTTWSLTRQIARDELAAFLSVVLVCGSIGMTAHIGDYSPHLLAFATYFLGIWLLVHSRVYVEQRPWQTHLWLGLYFAIACLAYNTGVMLVGVYLLSAVRRNHLLKLALAAAIGLSARPLWGAALGLAVSIEDVEADYLGRSLGRWGEVFQHDGRYIAVTLIRWISEYVLAIDSPLVVIFGLMCCLAPWMRCWTRRPASPGDATFALHWLGLVTLGVPVLAALVFAPTAGARGYLVYGGAIWLYAALATGLARMFGGQRRWLTWIGAAALSLLLASHFAWSAAHLMHFLGPAKTYFLGWDNGIEYLLTPRTEVHSLTDQEPVPLAFGGSVSLDAAGAATSPSRQLLQASQVSFVVALAARAWFVTYFGLLVLALARSHRQRIIGTAVVLVLYVASCASAALLFRAAPVFFKVDEATRLEAGQSLRYELTLGPRFLAALAHHAADGDRLVLFLRGPQAEQPLEVQVLAGGKPLPVTYEPIGKYAIRGESVRTAIDALSREPRLQVRVTNIGAEATTLLGWQRNDLAGRDCTYARTVGAAPARPDVLPVLEIRLLQENGRIKFAGF